MKKIRNKNIINYLASKGIYPKTQNDYCAIYTESAKLNALLDKCYIETVAFKNWMPRYFK